MLVSKDIVVIPTKTVFQDLVSRSTLADAESASPYPGMLLEVRGKLKNVEFQGSLEDIVRRAGDFDADKRQPMPGKYSPEDNGRGREYHPSQGREVSFLRKFDGDQPIDYTWIVKSVEDMLYGLCVQNEGGFNEYNFAHSTLRTIDSGDDEDSDQYTNEGDLLIDDTGTEYTMEEIAEAKTDMMYYLTCINSASKEMRVSLISLFRSYLISKSQLIMNNNRKTYQSSLSKTELVRNGIYRMSRDGHLGEMFKKEEMGKVKALDEALNLALNHADIRWTYLENLNDCCTKLNIDIFKDDITLFQEELLNNVKMTYITKNVDYVSRKYGGYNKAVKRALENMPLTQERMPLENYEAMAALKESDSEDDYVSDCLRTKQLFLNSLFVRERLMPELLNDSTDYTVKDQKVELFLTYYNYLKVIAKRKGDYLDLINSKDIRIDNNFYMTKYGEFVVIDASYILPHCLVEGIDYFIHYALMTANGFLILLTRSMQTYYCTIDDAKDLLEPIVRSLESGSNYCTVDEADAKTSWRLLYL